MSNNLPVNLPARVKRGDPVTAAWANSIREAVHKLANRRHKRGRGGTSGGGVILPFEVSVTGDSLIAAPGTVNGDAHAEEVNTTMTDGTWEFRAKVVINTTTGAVTSTDVVWESSPTADTSTDFYYTIAEVQIISGVPDSSTIVQYNYGPILVYTYGTPTDKWRPLIY